MSIYPTLFNAPREPSVVDQTPVEIRKKEQAYNEERNAAARRRMLSITFDDDDDSIPLGDIIARSKAITPDLPIEEPDNFLSMGDEHLDTIPSVEYLVPIPRTSTRVFTDNGARKDNKDKSEQNQSKPTKKRKRQDKSDE
ncbi:hypothetical protein Tco_0191364 [Tanacetum coccineum]